MVVKGEEEGNELRGSTGVGAGGDGGRGWREGMEQLESAPVMAARRRVALRYMLAS